MLVDVDQTDIIYLEEILHGMTKECNCMDWGMKYADAEWLEHFLAKCTGGKCNDCGADFSKATGSPIRKPHD